MIHSGRSCSTRRSGSLACVLRVGLSGGIGSGKSTVACRLSEHGAVVIDADKVAREVVEPGTNGLVQIERRFGDDVLTEDGALDREALGRIVFADGAARADLEAIVHPQIAMRTDDLIAAVPPEAVVVHDIPLLVELDRAADYHLTLIVGASDQIRHDRLLRDRGMASDDAWSRIRAQATDEQRHAAADVWLPNEGTPSELRDAVDTCWRERLAPFNDNLLTGIIADPSEARIVAYDDSWPLEAARLIGRIRKVLGERAADVQHIGSTSVPGLAAGDVIDLQIGVRALSDADDPEFIKALAEQGFPRVEEITGDGPQPIDPDPARWGKRFHGSCDPGRPAHVHVREIGSAGYRYAMSFRDWLRAVPAERAAYEREKQRLAAAHTTTRSYAEAKEAWFDEAMPRLQEWTRGH